MGTAPGGRGLGRARLRGPLLQPEPGLPAPLGDAGHLRGSDVARHAHLVVRQQPVPHPGRVRAGVVAAAEGLRRALRGRARRGLGPGGDRGGRARLPRRRRPGRALRGGRADRPPAVRHRELQLPRALLRHRGAQARAVGPRPAAARGLARRGPDDPGDRPARRPGRAQAQRPGHAGRLAGLRQAGRDPPLAPRRPGGQGQSREPHGAPGRARPVQRRGGRPHAGARGAARGLAHGRVLRAGRQGRHVAAGAGRRRAWSGSRSARSRTPATSCSPPTWASCDRCCRARRPFGLLTPPVIPRVAGPARPAAVSRATVHKVRSSRRPTSRA